MNAEARDTSRERFEAYFAASRKSNGVGRKLNFERLVDGTYADNHTQRHWWTWQQALAEVATLPVTAKDYEELRSIIDGGSETATHADAVVQLKEWEAASWKAGYKHGAWAAQPAGEPIIVEAVAEVVEHPEHGLSLSWLTEGGIHDLPEGSLLLHSSHAITDDNGSGEVYAHPPATVPDEWRKAVALAYGHLWHVNNEPLAPVPLRSDGDASYAARKLLRELLTKEERGEAINAVGQLLRAAPGKEKA